MEKYAVIKLGAGQYVVRENDVFEVERQTRPLKTEVIFYSDGTKELIGEPALRDVVVKLSLVGDKRARKIVVGRFKSKSRYKKKKGHRQQLSVIKVERIHLAGEKEEAPEEKITKPIRKTVARKSPVKKTAVKPVKKLPKKAEK